LQQLRCGQRVDVLSLSGSREEMEEVQHWRQRNQRELLHWLTLAEAKGASQTPRVQALRPVFQNPTSAMRLMGSSAA
jgi:hypothetical protein